MKKGWFFVLQLLSIFFFIAIFFSFCRMIKTIFTNGESLAYNSGYALGGLLVFGFFTWLNLKLFKYSNKG